MLDENLISKLGLDLQGYEELNDDEKKVVDQALLELSTTNNSKIYEDLYYKDYDEIPVSFKQFICDEQYLGKSTRNGTFLYPFWMKECNNIFENHDDCVEIALSGSIGVGKSTVACLMMAYHLYKMMCMKDPQAFFGLSPGSTITYAFLNNTLASSYGVGYSTVQSFLKESPWFLKHGSIVGRSEPEYKPEKGFDFIVGSKSQHTLGRHVAAALLDEVSFSPGQDVNYEKSKIMSLYTNIRRRMDSRFMVQGHNYGKMFLVSSKATESSFLEAYIADQIKKGYPIYVVDKPLWEVKPAAYSGRKFKVAVGNKFIPSRIVRGTEEEVKEACESYKAQGMRIINVPEEHLQAFDQNIDKALQDIAGISTSVVTKVFSMQRIEKCISDTYENPFRSEVVTLGTHDDLQLRDFFDESKIPDFMRTAPIFIHLDASVSGDRTGLSGVGIVGTKKSITYGNDVGEETTTDELVCQQLFTVGIQAPTDAEISFEKTRQFIYYLHREVGLNIKIITTDGFQSVDLRQIFDSQGYKTGYTSLDRKPDGYDSLKSAVLDQRIILLKGCRELWDELTDLEKDNIKMKYDHPVNGKKDEADSLAGAYLDALQYKDEFLYFHPDEFEYEDINKGDSIEYEHRDLVNSMLSSISGIKKSQRSDSDIIIPDTIPNVVQHGSKEEEDLFNYYGDSNILLF